MPVAMSLKYGSWLASKCEVQSYAIGVARPVSILETFGTGKVDDERLLELVLQHFETPSWDYPSV